MNFTRLKLNFTYELYLLCECVAGQGWNLLTPVRIDVASNEDKPKMRDGAPIS